MNDKPPNAASPFTTEPRPGDTGVTNERTPSSEASPLVRVQLVPAEDPPLAEIVTQGLAVICAIPAAAALVMVALGVLARNGVPVPALGYWDTLLVLLGVHALRVLARRKRWYL